MPTPIIEKDEFITLAAGSVSTGDIFFMVEPHGGAAAEGSVKYVEEIIKKTAGKGALVLEVSTSYDNKGIQEWEDFLAKTHTFQMKSLPKAAAGSGWLLRGIDGETGKDGAVSVNGKVVGKFGSARQDYCASNLKKLVKNTSCGCLVFFGRNHIMGSKGGKNLEPTTGFTKALTNKNFWAKDPVKTNIGDKMIYGQYIDRNDVN